MKHPLLPAGVDLLLRAPYRWLSRLKPAAIEALYLNVPLRNAFLYRLLCHTETTVMNPTDEYINYLMNEN